jgi:hypothetical protein
VSGPTTRLAHCGPQLVAFAEAGLVRWNLTAHEAAVLYYACCGLTESARIASHFGCLPHSYHCLRVRAYRKLGVLTCTAAVVRVWPEFVAATRGRDAAVA